MATNYPSGLDSFPARGALMSNTPQHGSVHDDLADAIEAIQVELGTNPSSTFAHVNQRIGAAEFSITQHRVVHPDGVALANDVGDFVGQTAWVTAESRLYLWDGTHWKIIGGNWPGGRLVRDSTHDVSTAGSNIPLSAHGGAIGTFRTGDILTVPNGLGGIYQLDFGAEFSQGAAFGMSVAVNIANNDTTFAWEPTQLVAAMEYESVGTFPVFPVVNHSRRIGLEPGATITFSGKTTVASRGPMMSYIGLQMVTHLPDLT